MSHDLQAAFEQWEIQIGSEHVRTDHETITRYASTTDAKSTASLGVLFPGNTEDLRAILITANQFHVSLYPISRGRNLGYGGACPVTEHNVIVDLSRMNRIYEVNEKLAYAVIEPGVTQEQLYRYLTENKIQLQIDVTGASPEASFIGNIAERGYGLTHYSDHFLNSSGMEIMLADGRIIKTGFGHYPKSKTTYLYKWGIGPVFDGLFTQSNFGIITKIGIWLMPKPSYHGFLIIKISDDQFLGEAIEKLRALKMSGVIPGALHLFNDLRAFASTHQYPWEEAGDLTPLAEDLKNRLARRELFDLWNGLCMLQGDRGCVLASVRAIKKALKKIARVQFLSKDVLKFRHLIALGFKLFKGIDFGGKLAALKIFEGIPTPAPGLMAYWRKKKTAPPDLDLLRDFCGLIWCSPVIPMAKDDSIDFVRITRSICRTYGFETNISMNLVSERAIDCVVAVLYDKENQSQTQMANDCHHTLLNRYLSEGYIPYRSGSQTMGPFVGDNPFWRICFQIKSVLDPNHILSPGRYNLLP